MLGLQLPCTCACISGCDYVCIFIPLQELCGPTVWVYSHLPGTIFMVRDSEIPFLNRTEQLMRALLRYLGQLRKTEAVAEA